MVPRWAAGGRMPDGRGVRGPISADLCRFQRDRGLILCLPVASVEGRRGAFSRAVPAALREMIVTRGRTSVMAAYPLSRYRPSPRTSRRANGLRANWSDCWSSSSRSVGLFAFHAEAHARESLGRTLLRSLAGFGSDWNPTGCKRISPTARRPPRSVGH